MTLLPLLLAIGLASPAAHAGKKGKGGDEGIGLRLKFNAPLYTTSSDSYREDGEEPEGFEPTKTNALTFLTGTNRTEITKLIGDGLEVGGILGYSSGKTVFDGDETGLYSGYTIGVTGAYNFKVSEGFVVYGQPLITYSKMGGQADPDADKFGFKGVGLGADVGLRIKLAKNVHIDPALEYFRQGYKPWSDNSDFENTDPEVSFVNTSMGLRLGLGVKF